MIENYEEDASSDKVEEKTGFWKKERTKLGGEEQPEGYEVAPTAKEYGSMLHILSRSKDVQPGANWERSMQLLREAQENEFPIDEGSYHTGIVLYCTVRRMADSFPRCLLPLVLCITPHMLG